MTDTERLALIREVFERAFKATDSFAGDDLGCELAYLFGAITGANEAECVEWREDSHEDHLGLFRELFCVDHPVWRFIEVPEEGESE